jgi:hypothetical protein
MAEVTGFYTIPTDNGHLKVIVRQTQHGLEIMPQGYGDNESMNGEGTPIYIEHFGGKLSVHIYGDINKAGPTHSISLEGALESGRKVTWI